MVRFIVCFLMLVVMKVSGQPLYQSKEFILYPDRVVQGQYTGKALSATALTSNYKSPVNEFLSPAVSFKFSINGKDNEMKSGVDHHINCSTGDCTTPVIRFGQQYVDAKAVADHTFLKPQTKLTIRLDMTPVMEAFAKDGFYTTYNGDKIYKQDFKGVYVAGGIPPLSWDFDNLVNKPGLKLQDNDGDNIYETTLVLNEQKDEKQTAAEWKLSKDLSHFPQYKSDYVLSDALYNLAMEEMINAVEPDSTFRTGKEWAGVWTRDISYSIILSMAYLQPQVAKNSLWRKVKNGKIVQDTGTGGAYPASTDRMIWAVAAWEVYKATGDKDWLQQAYKVIKQSVEDDLKNVFDETTGLMRGESSFLDWRDQTYPKWMQPADIYESECLGTNAVHYEANTVLAQMASLLKENEAEKKYNAVASSIKNGINQWLWLPQKGYYGQYLYGRRSKMLSPRSESLGEALTVLFGIADGDRAAAVIRNTPVMAFGVPCIYPQISNIPPYHNNAVWPFVQSYFALAASKAGNEAAVMESIAAVYRPAALWLTNKENFVSSNGDFAGTQINSSNMLWSLSGSISLVHKVLFGIRFFNNHLSFQPFVPQALTGKRSLTNFTYRNAILNIEMEGFGNKIKTFLLDGKPADATIAVTLKGAHSIKIILDNNKIKDQKTNQVESITTPDVPVILYNNQQLIWKQVPGAVRYVVYKNGVELAKVDQPKYAINKSNIGDYQVIAVDAKGISSFASEPVMIYKNLIVYEMEKFAPKAAKEYKGFSGDGFVEISKNANPIVTFSINIPADGTYALDFKYANGNGPTNTENKCAIRTLKEGENFLGTFIFPQRGNEEWSNWGYSNSIEKSLKKGLHVFTLSLEPANENMNVAINEAMLDQFRLIQIK